MAAVEQASRCCVFISLNSLVRSSPTYIVCESSGKKDTFGKKVNGHLGACSCFLGEMKYRTKEQAIDSRNTGTVLAG
jgi:hypothetical protein